MELAGNTSKHEVGFLVPLFPTYTHCEGDRLDLKPPDVGKGGFKFFDQMINLLWLAFFHSSLEAIIRNLRIPSTTYWLVDFSIYSSGKNLSEWIVKREISKICFFRIRN